jgi:hypothetical protein
MKFICFWFFSPSSRKSLLPNKKLEKNVLISCFKTMQNVSLRSDGWCCLPDSTPALSSAVFSAHRACAKDKSSLKYKNVFEVFEEQNLVDLAQV